MLESGEPGVHSFANSVYKVGPDEVGSSESEAVNSFKPAKKPFSTLLLQPEPVQYEQAQAQGMTMNLKMEMVSSAHAQMETDSGGWSVSDMSLLSDFSDMSSSEPEQDIFLPDLSSSLESLHNIEAFNFFNEKQNLAFC